MIETIETTALSPESVIERLAQAKVRTDNWGKRPGTKSLEEFIGYCQTGEYELDDDGDILKVRVNVATAFVRCIILPRLWEMYEDGRYRVDTHVANRRNRFEGSVAARIRTLWGEDAEGAIRRGIAKELGPMEPRFEDPNEYELRYDREESVNAVGAEGFPGIPATYLVRRHVCMVPPDMCHRRHILACDDGTAIVFKWNEMRM